MWGKPSPSGRGYHFLSNKLSSNYCTTFLAKVIGILNEWAEGGGGGGQKLG